MPGCVDDLGVAGWSQPASTAVIRPSCISTTPFSIAPADGGRCRSIAKLPEQLGGSAPRRPRGRSCPWPFVASACPLVPMPAASAWWPASAVTNSFSGRVGGLCRRSEVAMAEVDLPSMTSRTHLLNESTDGRRTRRCRRPARIGLPRALQERTSSRGSGDHRRGLVRRQAGVLHAFRGFGFMCRMRSDESDLMVELIPARSIMPALCGRRRRPRSCTPRQSENVAVLAPWRRISCMMR